MEDQSKMSSAIMTPAKLGTFGKSDITNQNKKTS